MTRANDGLRDHARVRDVLATNAAPEVAKQVQEDLFSSSERGAAKRAE